MTETVGSVAAHRNYDVMESHGYAQAESLLEPLAHINREHLVAMAADAVAEHTDFTTSTPTSPTQKRKRSGADSSPESRRSKRSTASTTLSATDPASAAYVESAVEAAQAAAQAANVNADFSALQQATVEHGESAGAAHASNTAPTALGSIYPSIHIPPSTDETFAAHPDPEPEHHAESSFGANDTIHNEGLPRSNSSAASLSQPSPQNQNGIGPSHSHYTSSLLHKPAVGSEEWHKLRKDNHKEGELHVAPSCLACGTVY